MIWLIAGRMTSFHEKGEFHFKTIGIDIVLNKMPAYLQNHQPVSV